MRLVVLFLLLASLTVAPVAGQRSGATQYIGLRYGPTLPKGLKNIGGALISGLNDEKEYTVSEIRKGRVRMLWFERLTHRDNKGVAYFELKDVLFVPAHPRSQVLVYSFCVLENRPDTEIVAIADYQPNEPFFTRVRKAWRANRQTEKFEVIPTKGIKCENIGYGV